MTVANDPPLDSVAAQHLEEIVERFESAWLRGERPTIDAYVPDGNLAVLVEIVHADLEFRVEGGETVRVEKYFERYPALAADTKLAVELILAEFRLRRKREPGMTPADCLQRFSRFEAALRQQLSGETSLQVSAGSFDETRTRLQTPAPVGTPLPSAVNQLVPGLGPRYRPVRFHARGGLGEVHVAQDQELRREVALKRIQAPWAGDTESRRRFLLEAEVTARLQHPGIVPIYGLVQDESGQPCYAMRFIEGQSLKEAIERFHAPGQPARAAGARNLALRELLTRFVAVCQTVAYAHSKGVLHRDLKPANVMLGPYGETLVVDWGLAKFLGEGPSPRTSAADAAPADGDDDRTKTGAVLGTPAYMSPEQEAGHWEAVGTASDIYSLGATLYALLTGQAPAAGPGPRADVAPPRSLRREVPAALEVICLKAMAHKPEGRYATALELAADVEHWLADEPVAAYREPAALRLARWGRQHKLMVVGGVTVLASAVFALAVGNYLLSEEQVRTEAARRHEEAAKLAAQAARREAEQAQAQAHRAADQARLEAERSGRVSEFLAALFQVSDPTGLSGYAFRTNREKASRLTAGEILDLGARKIAIELKDQPEIRATLMDTIGNVYRSLGMYEKAARLLRDALALREKVLGADHLDVAASLHHLGWLEHDRGDYGESEKLFRRALALRQRHLGDASLVTAATKFNLAWLLTDRAKLQEAERLFREVLALRQKQLGDGHRETTIALGGLVALLLHSERYLEATPYIDQGLKNLRAYSGEEPVKAIGLYQQAVFERKWKNYKAAEKTTRDCLKILHQLGCEEHPFAAFVQFELGQVYEAQGDRKRAEAQYRIALAIGRNAVDLGHPKLMYPVTNLARLLAQRKEFAEGKQLYQEVLAAQAARFGKNHVMRADTLTVFGNYVLQFGNRSEAESLLREALDIYRASKEDTPSHRDTALANLAWLLLQKQDFVNAEHSYREALPLLRKKYGARDGLVGFVLSNLAVALMGQGKFGDAEPLLKEALPILRGDTRMSPQEQVVALERLARLHRARGEYSQAAARLREALDQGRKLFAKNPERVAQLAANLAGALMDLEDYEAARTLFEEALALTPQPKGVENSWLAHRLRFLALNRLAASDGAGYRALCGRLVSEFAGTKDAFTACTVNRTTVLTADATDQGPRLLRLAEDTVQRHPKDAFARLLLGAVLYRAGRFEEAVARLQEAVTMNGGQVTVPNGLFLAMALSRLGQAGAARAAFDQTVLTIDRAAKEPAANDRLTWIDRLEHQLLRREAAALFDRRPDSK